MSLLPFFSSCTLGDLWVQVWQLSWRALAQSWQAAKLVPLRLSAGLYTPSAATPAASLHWHLLLPKGCDAMGPVCASLGVGRFSSRSGLSPDRFVCLAVMPATLGFNTCRGTTCSCTRGSEVSIGAWARPELQACCLAGPLLCHHTSHCAVPCCRLLPHSHPHQAGLGKCWL